MNAPAPQPGPGVGAGVIPPPPVQQSSLWNRFRSAFITLFSTMLTALVIGNAYYQRQQFYPSVVYITKSNPSMAVIYVQAFVFVILFGKLMRKIFFGRLRAAEFEHLMERSWYAVTETCLAFTVFKDDFSPKFVALFTLLLFLKSFHWLAEDRVDFMERSPAISTLFHLRVISLNLLLALADIKFIVYAYESTLSKGPSVQLVFGFEYAILLTIVANTIVKYILHSIDLYGENPWENKAVFMLYTELAIGLIKVVLYVIFIAIMIGIYTLPLFAVRPMYLTMRAFKKAFNDVILSRRAIHNMNTCYPDATTEELAATDNVCIICREEMTASPTTKKLPCNHIFHKNCLRSWFQRQQTCPTCRLDVLRVPAQQQQQQQQQRQGGLGGQQQQQQQQRQGGLPQQPQHPPPFDPMNIFAQFQAAGRMPPFPPPGTSGASGNATSSASSGTNNNNFAARPPFLPPPFPFFSPFTIPPPMPPPNFAGMTDDELRAMEGQERENVEARIKCLRNIQVLLDAAVLQMQQYSTITGSLSRSPNTAAPSSSTSSTATTVVTASSTVTTPTTSAAATEAAAAAATPGPETGAKPKNKSALNEIKKESVIKKNDLQSDNQPIETDAVKEELRKRRLAKFEAENNNTTSD